MDVLDHPELREGDGSPIKYVVPLEFQNWGRTVQNTPAQTYFPQTKAGICAVVQWAASQGLTVRASGYRHTWSNLYSDDGEILLSMLPLTQVADLPADEPGIDPTNEMQGIEITGTVTENGVTKALCRIGSATTNEQLRRWALDPNGGNWQWTIPLNVIMVEITLGGSNAPACHGAGIRNETLSDLVTEIEFVNAKGVLQTVSDPALLPTAAACFGLLGIVTSLTIKLDPMSYAVLKPKSDRVALTVPPPVNYKVPAGIDMTGITPAQLDQARANFASTCENAYYSEWFWFPYQQNAWSNCWNNDGKRADAKPYPGDWGSILEEWEEYIVGLLESSFFKLLSGKSQAELFGAVAMEMLPSDITAVTPVSEALHFRRGIQNFRVLDMELEIPVPTVPGNPSKLDWSIPMRAWWDAISIVMARPDGPMRTTMEMRVMGGSGVLMAPEHGNTATCSIEVLTTLITPTADWMSFKQQVVNAWTSYKDANGQPLNVRPHWAKEWEGLTFRGQPATTYLRNVAYAGVLPQFGNGLRQITSKGGYPVQALRMFSNPLLTQIVGL